ncbi:hypothetical protein H9655_08290 [Cytobacillus sp. Sa5YUA1]|uniref:Terminase n=1 Tax=Cytobacillus stercorigallinarum TaxID=2762240 RepID=A0ABR8QNE3_9BACI|nr:hypothetical protein [Cytobacillus stercorigallinarum]MBD7937028.1 hypothetical protein [Cytobacillus stercorigallinarum]
MARGVRTSTNQLKMKASKAQIAAREQAEELVVTNATKPKASPMLTSEERKMFNKLKKRNDNYTESDSESLNLLAQYLTMWYNLKQHYNALDVFDERSADIERRMIALDKQIAAHMSALAIPLSQRFRLANDMAKVMIEERKLQQMEVEKRQEVNPLLALLEDDDDE